MDKILICKNENCNKFLVDPIFLPCGFTVCRAHIDELKEKNSEQFKCECCSEDHLIPKNGFLSNKMALEALDNELHLSSKEKEIQKLINTLSKVVNDFDLINRDPESFTFEYIANIRNEIDKERERLISTINTISNAMMEKLKEFEKECKTNVNKLQKLHGENETSLLTLKSELNNFKVDLRSPNKGESKIEKMITDLEEILRVNKEKLLDFKNQLLSGSCQTSVSASLHHHLFSVAYLLRPQFFLWLKAHELVVAFVWAYLQLLVFAMAHT